MPTVKDTFINLTGTAGAVLELMIARGAVFANEAEMTKRIDICVACEHYITTGPFYHCDLCNCGMKIKTRLAAAKCPIDKWLALVPRNGAFYKGSSGALGCCTPNPTK